MNLGHASLPKAASWKVGRLDPKSHGHQQSHWNLLLVRAWSDLSSSAVDFNYILFSFGRFINPSHAGWVPLQMFSRTLQTLDEERHRDTKEHMQNRIFKKCFYIYIVISTSEILLVASKEKSARSPCADKIS